MNHCAFFGQVVSIHYDELLLKVTLSLLVENKRKNKTENKKIDREVIKLEAWGTAAINIIKNVDLNSDFLVIDSTARSFDDSIVFRINEFKVIKG
jgi:pyruvate carboxylase